MKHTRRNRKATRRNRKASRRNHKGRKAASRRSQRGGWVVLNPATVNDTSMNDASKQNLAQGGEYKQAHVGQYGGGAVLEGAPVGTTGVLDSSLRTAAYLAPLDRSLSAIQGMNDQSGGGRRNRKASRKASRKGRKASRKGRKASRRNYRGGAYAMNPADASAPGTLLPSDMASKALSTMNPEWKLAQDPAAFAPKA